MIFNRTSNSVSITDSLIAPPPSVAIVSACTALVRPHSRQYVRASQCVQFKWCLKSILKTLIKTLNIKVFRQILSYAKQIWRCPIILFKGPVAFYFILYLRLFLPTIATRERNPHFQMARNTDTTFQMQRKVLYDKKVLCQSFCFNIDGNKNVRQILDQNGKLA